MKIESDHIITRIGHLQNEGNLIEYEVTLDDNENLILRVRKNTSEIFTYSIPLKIIINFNDLLESVFEEWVNGKNEDN